LPLAGLLLSGQEWSEVLTVIFANNSAAATENIAAILLTTLMLPGYVLLINLIIKRQTGNSPMNTQLFVDGYSRCSARLAGGLPEFIHRELVD
jgi:hypothetical protein